MKAATLYPYEVSERLVLRLSDFDDPVAGTTVSVRELSLSRASNGESTDEAGAAAYDATQSDQWGKLTFRLTVTLEVGELERVFPPTSDVRNDASLVVLMTCPSTRFRRGVRLRHTGSGQWVGHASVQRDDVQGSLTLRPQLVRVSSIAEIGDLPYATREGALVAFGEPVPLYVDSLPPSLGSGLSASVTMAWEDFANSDDPWRREHSDDVYYLEPFGSEPRLWLNSRYAQLRELLESTAKRGREAALRDMFGILVAQPVWLQLCVTSLSALEVDDDSGSVSAPSGWRGDLAAMVLPRLYPEEADPEERLRRAASEFREADGAASVASRLGTVVQGLLTSYKTVELTLRTFENVRNEEDRADD
jgi:hypothetical protein